jgi:predicted phage tail protein
MLTVLLYGHLGKRFGRRHRYEVRSPAEAVRALCATIPGFRVYLAEHSAPGYRVLVGTESRDLETLAYPAREAIKIVPVTAGAGRGLGSVILGAALFMISGPGGWLANTLYMEAGVSLVTAGAIGVMAGQIGVSLMLGGVSQMLAPQPKTPGAPDRPENKPSYAFDGAVNTAAQGNPVPVCYGRLIVGSQVISAGMVAEEYAP